MSKRGKRTGHGNAPAISQQPYDNETQIYDILQNFEGLPSGSGRLAKLDRSLFKWIIPTLIIILFVYESFFIYTKLQITIMVLRIQLCVYSIILTTFVLLFFNMWRLSFKKT